MAVEAVMSSPAPAVDARASRLLRWVSGYALRRWRGLIAVLATMIAKIGVDLLKPWPLKVLVDYGLSGQALTPALAAMAAVLPGADTREGLITWSVASTVLLFIVA
jgi:ATP-binding cassette subfamily B protein